jgi:hypothetical protein
MTNIDKLDNDKLLEVAQKMGYDPKKSNGLEEYTAQISKMDLWDRSKVLFFGTTWEKY